MRLLRSSSLASGLLSLVFPEASNLIYRNYATQALKCLRLIRTRSFNPQDEMLSEEQVKVLFEETAADSPEEIMEHLKKAGEVWARASSEDDVTFVAVKIKQ